MLALANSYTLLTALFFFCLPQLCTCPQARAAALRALELDQGLGGGTHPRLALIVQTQDWDWANPQKQRHNRAGYRIETP